jgi:hypothetical protein
MRPLRRRTRFEKAVKAARDAKLPSSVGSAVSDIHPPKAVKSGVTAVVAATAASAVVSALRRRLEEESSDR